MSEFMIDPNDDIQVGRRIATASDQRRRVAERMLHDGVQQHMALMGLRLSMLQRKIENSPEQAAAMCSDLREEVQQALVELRGIAHFIFPAILENEGIGTALERAAERLQVTANVEVDPELELSEDVRSALYFCCLEAMSNAAHHAGTDVTVAVRIGRLGDLVRVEVSDNGVGFAVGEGGVSGLQHIADRIHVLGGVLEIVSSASGTHVVASLPIA